MLSLGLSFLGISIAFGLGFMFRYLTLGYETTAKTASVIADVKSQQLRATVSASLDGIIIIDAVGNVIEFSESAERIFGYSKDDVLGKNMAELIVPERYRDAHNAGMERMRETGVAKILGQRIEIEAMRADGTEFISELAISRSPGDDGDIFIAYLRDISDAKAAEAALKDSKIKAEEASEVKTKFLAAMSHEIRTPFNAVLGILDLLNETKLNKDQHELVETARTSSQALLRIINDTLDYAKITSGKVSLANKPFMASNIFNDVKDLFAPVAANKGLDFEMSLDVPEGTVLSGDSGRIKQILMNFVSNAIKFTDEGAISMIIKTAQRADGRYDLFCGVQDKGIGIPADKQEALFGEFYMVDATDTREHEGTGLGLAISRKLTRMMDGEIGVKSKEGKGSLFWMTVPLEKSDEVPVSTRQHSDKLENIDGVHILLAEDNKTNQMVMLRTLKKLKATARVVENGQDAIDALGLESYDLILMDISMPVMGGLQATRAIRQANDEHSDIPIIALTAIADTDDKQRFMDAGMNDVLIKPAKRSDLTRAIAAVISEKDKAMKQVEEFKKLKTSEVVDKSKKESEVMGNVQIADQAILNELFDGISVDELKVFKDQLHSDLADALDGLSKALGNSDRDLAERSSHIIKGLAGTYGLTGLSEAAALTNSHCHSTTSKKWLTEGKLSEEIGKETLSKIDAVFDLIEVSAA